RRLFASIPIAYFRCEIDVVVTIHGARHNLRRGRRLTCPYANQNKKGAGFPAPFDRMQQRLTCRPTFLSPQTLGERLCVQDAPSEALRRQRRDAPTTSGPWHSPLP